MSRISKILKIVVMGTSLVFLIGCGGGGPTPAPAPTPTPAPAPKPTPKYIKASPPRTTLTPEMKDKSYWKTTEYDNVGGAYDQIKLRGAYVQGYSGKGVNVGIIGSGISYGNHDLSKNLVKSVSTYNYLWDENNHKYVETSSLVKKDQIETIYVNNGGENYTSAPKITITGSKTDDNAKAIAILDANGGIKEIRMTKFGSNYDYKTAHISIDSNGTNGSNFEIGKIYYGGEDEIGHDSGTAGLISASRDQKTGTDILHDKYIHGVAFNSHLYTSKIFNKKGSSGTLLYKSLEWMKNQPIDILNLSIGTIYNLPAKNTAFETLLKNNKIFVISAGNNGLDCKPDSNGKLEGHCSFPAALPYYNHWILDKNVSGGWLAVGSVDKDNNISSFSNRAGVMKDYYIVAPGENLITPSIDNHYQRSYGTSFSAPLVTGAISLLKEKYPYLKGKELTQILLQTATDLGKKGVDDVYGAGLLNVEKAFQPIGILSVPNGNNINKDKTPIFNSSLNLSSTFGNILLKTQSLNKTIGLDNFNRTYKLNMTSAIHSNSDNFSFNDFYQIVHNKNIIIGLNNNNVMLGYYNKNTELLFSMEKNLFRSKGQGSYDLGKSKSYYIGYNKGYMLNPSLAMFFKVNYGLGTSNTHKGLFNNFSNLQALGGGITIQYNNYGFQYDVPLHIVSGNVNMNIPVSRDMQGNIKYLKVNQNLAVKDYEQDFSFFFNKDFKLFNLKASYKLIKNKDNYKTASLDNNFYLEVNKRF